MAAPVRPPNWPTVPANTQPVRGDARAAAQKAFFDAALAGKTTATVAQVAEEGPPRPTQSAAQAVRSVQAADARATDRLPPPGSLLNILV